MYAIYYYLVLLIFELIMFVTGAVLLLLTFPFDKNRKIIHLHSFVWGMLHFWVNPFWKVHYSGKKNIKRGKPYIIICNHQSMLDICLIYELPLYFKWVSKKEALRIPMVGQALWFHRDILINRGEGASVKQMIKKAQAFLKDNISISIFPEGTRTQDGKIHPFKEGAFLLARLTKTAILPIVIDGTFDVMPKNSYAVKRKKTFYMNILPEITADEVARTPVKDMAEKLHNLMLSEHKNIAPQKYQME